MKNIWDGFEIFNTAPWAICIAIIACIAKQAHHGWQGTKTFIRELIICIFMGMLLAWWLEGSGYPMGMQGAIIGGGAFAGGSLIDPLFRKAISMIENWHGKVK